MKKNPVKIWVCCGIFCALSLLLSTWYAVTFNDSRLVVPTELASYAFVPKDLPVILSISLTCLYLIALFLLLFVRVWKSRRRTAAANTTRRLNPKLGFLGLLGFLGFAGFWTYSVNRDVFPFAFFLFFGFFGFFYEGKLSETFMDERFRENAAHAQLNAYKITFRITLIALIVLCQGKLFRHLEYTLIAGIIVLSLTLALGIFLSEYLLYRYDHGDQTGEDEG